MTFVSIPCLVFQQRLEQGSQRFAIFAATPFELLTWATIQRRSEHENGQQRRLSQAKIKAISKFLGQDPRNIIAPAITVAFRPGKVSLTGAGDEGHGGAPQFTTMQVEVPAAGTDAGDFPAVVIDGQHRLLGLQEFNPQSKFPVVGLLETADIEIAFQFVVINNKATRVSTDMIRTLAIDYREQDLKQRLKDARVVLNSRLELVGFLDNDPESPFFGRIALEAIGIAGGDRVVPPAAIESAFAVIDAKNIPELSGDDALLAFFSTIWGRVKLKWPGLWQGNSRLLHKVSVVAMTQFLADALMHQYDYAGLDVTDSLAVSMATDQILCNQVEEFWTTEWRIELKDSKAMRERIIDGLLRIGRNVRSNVAWDQDVDLIAR
jgi:DGQHR domain-containing protein